MISTRDGFKIHYGFRGGGEKFLVHEADVNIAAHLFDVVDTGPRAPRVERQPVAPPAAIVEEAEPEPMPSPKRIDLDSVLSINRADGIQPHEAKGARDVLDQFDREQSGEKLAALHKVNSHDPEDYLQAVSNNGDLQKIPGITYKIAEQMKSAGIVSAHDIMELGEDGLQKFDGLGPVRTKAIFNAVAEMTHAV